MASVASRSVRIRLPPVLRTTSDSVSDLESLESVATSLEPVRVMVTEAEPPSVVATVKT